MKKPGITIGIPVHNEEYNIRYLIKELLNQNHKNYTLEKIIVASDCSTDMTNEILKRYKCPKLMVVIDNIRRGQNYRINQIIKASKSEIIVLVEGDTLPASINVIDELVKPFTEGIKNIGMVFGRWEVLSPRNIYEQITYSSSRIKRNIFKSWNNGDNVYFVGGHSIKALNKNKAVRIKLPPDVPEDTFYYFSLKERGLKAIYSERSNMKYRNVSNFRDRMLQLNKFQSGINSLQKYFLNLNIKKEYTIPANIVLTALIKEFVINPVMTMFSLSDFLVTRILSSRNNRLFNPFYKTYKSSKTLVVQ